MSGPHYTQVLNYGPHNHIEQAGNAFTGINYGTLIQNWGEDANWLDSLAQRLKISPKADYGYYSGVEEGNLRRGDCTPGTRVKAIDGITRWACDTSPNGENIFWLSGQGGAGKTTIAHTIAELFAHNSTGGTTLGGSFFCSRHSPETRATSAVVRTIVYRLALRSLSFRAALKLHGDFEAVNRGPKSQLEALLVKPWQESAPQRLANNEPCYVVPIDALDELDAAGGTEILGALITIVKKHDLLGLKFFVTSRLEPALVEQIESFDKKQLCRLEKISLNESSADIKVYLQESIGKWATSGEIEQLAADAAGLFIFAATVVEYLKGRSTAQQRSLFNRILTIPHPKSHPRGATAKLDDLYRHILKISLVDPRDLNDPVIAKHCLAILHTFLCTVERTPTDVAVGLLEGANSDSEAPYDVADADELVGRLHAVLYSQNGQVLWFHKSFLDFVFNEGRSETFFCDRAQHHRTLATGCFEIMRRGLRFNIANVTTSYRLDCDNPTLAESIKTNISATLSYASRAWSGHLSLTLPTIIDPLLDTLRDFLHLQVLFWIEAMNLMKLRGLCESMLLEARRWADPPTNSPNLVDDLEEAAAFAFHFSANGAAQSTPHLYISSLATFSRDATLLSRWRQHFPGIPAFTNTQSTILLSSTRFKSGVNAVAVSVDGMQIALGFGDGLVRVRALATGEELAVLKGHTALVASVAYSPEGKHIISGSRDGSLRMWDISSGEQLRCLEGHTHWVTSVRYSPDGKHAVSGSYDKSLLVWDVFTGEQLQRLEGHTAPVTSVAYSPDSKYIISGSRDKSLQVWDVSTGEQLKCLGRHTETVTSVAYSPDGKHIVSGSFDESLRVWDVSTGEQLKCLQGHTSPVATVAYSPDGKHIVSGSRDKSLRVWDVSSGKQLKCLEGHTGGVDSVVYSPDSKRIISGSRDKSLRVWDTSTGEQLKPCLEGHTHVVTSAAYSPDGKHLISGSCDESLRVWDVSTGEQLNRLQGHTGCVYSMAYSPDGTCIVSGSGDKSLRVWDTSTGEQLKCLEGHTGLVTSAAYSPDGTHIVSGSHDQSMRVWDVSTGEELKYILVPVSWINSVAYSPDGKHIVSGSPNQSLRVWDVCTGEQLKSFEGHTGSVDCVVYSPDGKHIMSGSSDKSLRVWDVSTGEQLKYLEGHTSWVSSVAYSPDGTCIVSGSGDRTLRVWEVSTGEQLECLEGHADGVTSVSYSPDSKYIVSGSYDTSLRIWAPFKQHSDRIRYIRQKSSQGEHTGWLVSPTDPSAHLMLVPVMEGLPDDSNVLTMPTSFVPHVDLSKASLGEAWTRCYSPMD